jgi:ATP-dependent Zn protease
MYGMSDSLGPQALGQRDTGGYVGAAGESRIYSERVAEAIDAEVRALIDAGMRQAEEILSRHRDVLEALALRLVEDETIEGDELEQIFSGADATSDGVVRPLPRYRYRARPADLAELPRLAAGLASAVTEENLP